MEKLLTKIKKDIGLSTDFIFKELIFFDKKITLIYSELICSTDLMNDFILKPIIQIENEQILIPDIYEKLYNILPDNNVKKIEKYQEIIDDLYNGYCLIIIDEKALAIEVRESLSRGVSEPTNEPALQGPKDGFCENVNTNLGILRKRIKSNHLYIETQEVGSSSKTKVGIVYMNNICEKKLVDEVKKKIKNVNIDGIIDSGYIKRYLGDKNSFFPTIMSTERCDNAAMAVLEGKIVILVDNSCYALILPTFLIDYFHNPDDYYQKYLNVSFIRIIRIFAFIISIFLPAYYIAVTTINHDAIPVSMLINFTTQRLTVPFPALIEALLMSIAFEILRESDMRMSNNVGTAVSVLGGLVLGDAAVSAGIVSPIMIIVIAISAISGLVFTSVELTSAIRWWRYIFMFLGAFLGIYGIFLGMLFLIISLAKINHYGKPYLYPFAPFYKKDLDDAILFIHKKEKRRNKYLTKNIIRGKQ